MKFILGLKLGMAQIFDEKGNVVPVTLIGAGPCTVTQIKTKEPKNTEGDKKVKNKKDGYESVQIGFRDLKEKKVKKTQKQKPFRYLREFRENIDISKYKEGDIIDVSIFQEGDKIKVSGFSKGKGFAGVVKKWNFAGRSATHGNKHELRTQGSIGSAYPQRVIKGKKMAGRMGNERITVKNLEIAKIDKENSLLAVKGALPGRKGSLLEIKSEK